MYLIALATVCHYAANFGAALVHIAKAVEPPTSHNRTTHINITHPQFNATFYHGNVITPFNY